jgi:hypothetical protein
MREMHRQDTITRRVKQNSGNDKNNDDNDYDDDDYDDNASVKNKPGNNEDSTYSGSYSRGTLFRLYVCFCLALILLTHELNRADFGYKVHRTEIK